MEHRSITPELSWRQLTLTIPSRFSMLSMMRLACSAWVGPPARLDPVQIAVEINLEHRRRMIGGAPRFSRRHSRELQRLQIQRIDENLDCPNRVVFRHIVIKRCWQQIVLPSVLERNGPSEPPETRENYTRFRRFYTASGLTRHSEAHEERRLSQESATRSVRNREATVRPQHSQPLQPQATLRFLTLALSPAQPRRTLLQPDQAVSRHRHPLCLVPRKLPRRRPTHLYPDLVFAVMGLAVLL